MPRLGGARQRMVLHLLPFVQVPGLRARSITIDQGRQAYDMVAPPTKELGDCHPSGKHGIWFHV